MLPGIRTCWLDELATTFGRSRRAPALDEVIARRILDLLGQGRVDLDRGAAGADAQVVEPGRQDRGLDAVPLRERDQLDAAFGRARLGRGVQALGRRTEGSLAQGCQLAGNIAHVAEQQVGTARRNQPGPIPDHDVVLIAVAGVARHQVNVTSPPAVAGILSRSSCRADDRADRLHPGLRAADLADLPDAREPPERLLPAAISDASAGRLSDATAASEPRTPSRIGERSPPFSVDQRIPRYFAFRPSSRATSAMLLVPEARASRCRIVARRYFSSGSRPPSLVPKTIPCRLTCVPPPESVNRA